MVASVFLFILVRNIKMRSMKPHNNFNNIVVPKNKFQCNEHHRRRHHITNLVAISIYNVLKPNLSYIKCDSIYGERERKSTILNVHILLSLVAFLPHHNKFRLWFICAMLFDHLSYFHTYIFQTVLKWMCSFKILVTGVHVRNIPLWQRRSVSRLRMKNERYHSW